VPQASMFLVIDGAVYAIITPIWGVLLDRRLNARYMKASVSDLDRIQEDQNAKNIEYQFFSFSIFLNENFSFFTFG
jgi:hypothetical protein